MSRAQSLGMHAGILLLALLLSGCGGGGTGAATAPALPAAGRLNLQAQGCEFNDRMDIESAECSIRLSWNASSTETVWLVIDGDEKGKLGMPVGKGEAMFSYLTLGAGRHDFSASTSQISETVSAEIRCEAPMTVVGKRCAWTEPPKLPGQPRELLLFGDEQKNWGFDTQTRRIAEVLIVGKHAAPGCGCSAGNRNLAGAFPLLNCAGSVYFFDPERWMLHLWQGALPADLAWYGVGAVPSPQTGFPYTATFSADTNYRLSGILSTGVAWVLTDAQPGQGLQAGALYRYMGGTMELIHLGAETPDTNAANCRISSRPRLLWVASTRAAAP